MAFENTTKMRVSGPVQPRIRVTCDPQVHATEQTSASVRLTETTPRLVTVTSPAGRQVLSVTTAPSAR